MPTAVSDAPGGSNRFAQRLFSPLPERYDRLAEVLSFGQNGRWRRALVDHVVEASPGLVLDVATGPAGVALQIAARTGARVVGVDVTEAMLRRARLNVGRAGARVHLALGRGEQLPFADGTFDAVTFTYLLRYVDDPAATVRELSRVVRPGGVLANLEFLVPSSRFWRFWWWGYTRLVLPLAGWATGGREWFDVGRFLGPNISSHYRRYPVAWTVEAWRDAGMVDVGVRPMSLGGGLVMWGTRAGA
ncbi:MAG TPA: class I SAM-dependent methyltransferase [Acidimicrobiales bacterium]|nr:class I SAM-dependent methyltransferase [Acidimicrobiales bacterium]